MERPAAISHHATTLTIATNHANAPNRGKAPARVRLSNAQGESIATAKLYNSRHATTPITPPFLLATPRLLPRHHWFLVALMAG